MTRFARVTAGIAASSLLLALAATTLLRDSSPQTAQVGEGFPYQCDPTVFEFMVKESVSIQTLLGETTEVVAADSNGDGFIDLQTSTKVYLGKNDGGMTFVPYGPQGEDNQGQLLFVDVNGDGKGDRIAKTSLFGGFTVRLGDGTGRFGAPINTQVAGGGGFLTAGDFNRDGKIDVAVGNSQALVITLGDGQGRFTEHRRYGASGSQGQAMAVGTIASGDVDGDGMLDLAFLNKNLALEIWLGTGTGDFAHTATVPAASSLYNQQFVLQLLATDYTGDGLLDFLVADPAKNRINVISRTGGNWQVTSPFQTIPNPMGYAITPMVFTVADFDGDGGKDVAVGTKGNGVYVLGGVPKSYVRNYYVPQVRGIATADFDRDGRMDLAIARHDGYLDVKLNKLYCFSSSSLSVQSSGTSSSAGVPSCTVPGGCPLGACPGGQTYQQFSCMGNQCIPLNYAMDPCRNFAVASSSAHSSVASSGSPSSGAGAAASGGSQSALSSSSVGVSSVSFSASAASTSSSSSSSASSAFSSSFFSSLSSSSVSAVIKGPSICRPISSSSSRSSSRSSSSSRSTSVSATQSSSPGSGAAGFPPPAFCSSNVCASAGGNVFCATQGKTCRYNPLSPVCIDCVSASAVAGTSSSSLGAGGLALQPLPSSSQSSRSDGPLLALSILCGNGKVDAGEACDDANQSDIDGCTARCKLGPIAACVSDSQCDSRRCVQNRCAVCVQNSQCPSNICEAGQCVNLCGNGNIDAGEACDDGNANNTDACSTECLLTGNQACVSSGQCGTRLCDNGICTSCTSDSQCPGGTCQAGKCIVLCGNGYKDPGEECDDGNRIEDDACTSSCRFTGFDPETGILDVDLLRFLQGGTNPDLTAAATGHPAAGETGPTAVLIMVSGAAAGWAWVRRRRRK